MHDDSDNEEHRMILIFVLGLNEELNALPRHRVH
jgi:hypothetical protein